MSEKSLADDITTWITETHCDSDTDRIVPIQVLQSWAEKVRGLESSSELHTKEEIEAAIRKSKFPIYSFERVCPSSPDGYHKGEKCGMDCRCKHCGDWL